MHLAWDALTHYIHWRLRAPVEGISRLLTGFSLRSTLAEVLGLEPYQLIRSGMFGKQDILNENLRFVQRSIESIITEILEDDKMPKDKKVNALTKYYSVLIKAKK